MILKNLSSPLPENATLNQYQKLASGTAIYPGSGTPLGLIYCALKMNGEAGEFAEHVGKAMRDNNLMEPCVQEYDGSRWVSLDGELTEERRTKLILELGDVLWYISSAARELGVTLEEVGSHNIDKLLSRKTRGTLGGSGDDR